MQITHEVPNNAKLITAKPILTHEVPINAKLITAKPILTHEVPINVQSTINGEAQITKKNRWNTK